MSLIQAYDENKPKNKPWGAEKEEFENYNARFIRLIEKLTADFYLEEADDNLINEIIELCDDIKKKIDVIKSYKK